MNGEIFRFVVKNTTLALINLIEELYKITNTEYFLPVVDALYGDKEFGTGTTRPMLIRGVCSTTGEKSDYVVKFRNAHRMSNESSCRELVAAFIARELDMHVVEPALVNISPDFVETLIGRDGYKNAANSLGLNYGCKHVPGYIEFIRNQSLSISQYDQAQDIFAFDIFVGNADRRFDKQNMLTDGEKILIFDHELAFGFVMDIIKNPEPWLITLGDLDWIKNHYFYPILRQNEHNFDMFVDSFEVIDENFWNRLLYFIPKDWITNEVEQIKRNLQLLIMNKQKFRDELYRVLS